MSRSLIIMVCDNPEQVEFAKKQWEGQNVNFQAFSPTQWKENLENVHFVQQISGSTPSLVGGAQPIRQVFSNNVVQFPTAAPLVASHQVTKMEELELHAIQNAIKQFQGNLTEAAKALGIGRATLYRRVKYFKIDPNQSRKKRAA